MAFYFRKKLVALCVFVFDQPHDALLISTLLEGFAEDPVFKKARYPGQCFKVRARRILRRYQKKEDMHRFAVERIETHALVR